MWLGPKYSPDKSAKGKTIVSLVPSLTELLFDLGLGGQVIGRTKFCVHPQPEINSIPIIGGTKKIHVDKIRRMKPDILLANKEENTREDIDAIRTFSHVYLSDISDMGGLTKCILDLADSIPETKSTTLLNSLASLDFAGIFPPLRVAYLIWYNPLMTIGHDTFIHYMLSGAGLLNVFADRERYPQTSLEELKTLQLEVLFLSSEPFPFSEKHVQEFREFLPATKVLLADGEMFSWYGSRILSAPAYFRKLADQLK